MLRALELENFRGFDRHEVRFSRRTLLVGANNAGKSTLVEALRLVSLIANRPGLTAQPIPDWLADAAGAPFGFAPSLRGMDFELGPSAFHGFGDPPARIIATFESGAKISVFIGPEGAVFAVVRSARGTPVKTLTQRDAAGVTRVGVQPQVGPVQRREEIREDDYVQRALDTSLAPLHFQNQIRVLTAYWDDFRADAESTWNRLQLNRPQVVTDYDAVKQRDTTRVQMLVRDGPYTGELSSMGHGLQMWLQMMWFLARTRHVGTVVLDEPDVYMHADLQRKLIRFIGGVESDRQMIIATHSVEMMAEVDPAEIVVVDATRRRSRSSRTVGSVQQAINDLGGVHTLQYARLWNAKRCLLLEGKDMSMLKPAHDLLAPRADALDVSPYFGVGGWGGWNYAQGISQFVKEADPDIAVYCIFDSDYHWPDEIDERYQRAADRGIELHIWLRKEIESYLLQPELILRAIAARGTSAPTLDEVRQEMERIADDLQAEVLKGFLDTYREPTSARSTALEAAERHMTAIWISFEAKMNRVPAKDLISRLSSWSKAHFDASFGVGTLTRAMRAGDVDAEIVGVLTSIEQCQSLPRRSPSG